APTITAGYVNAIRSVYVSPKELPEPPEPANNTTNANLYQRPEYSPLFADLSGMPPVLIQAGGFEVLRSDSEALVKNYRKYGSFARLEIYKRGWHVFQLLPTPMAAEAMEHVGNFIQEHK
ncbi:MAG: alpha/beta hydrolase, partial [Lachnospiraceae bacterium]|nr:alpha/beta hydrolase [Lachnospiraceae bacterium]